MNRFIGELNDDQLDGLSNLCFDIAKASIVLALLPTQIGSENFISLFVKILFGLFWGIVFIYLAMIALKSKKRSLI